VVVSLRRARAVGAGAIAVAVGAQLFNDFACYQRGVLEALSTLWFPAIPLVPSLVALGTANPLRAVAGALVATGFYLLAYYVDCVVPYRGGGASMVYVAVILYGLPLALVAVLVAGPVMRWLGVVVEAPAGGRR
jgi:hypothetical protein